MTDMLAIGLPILAVDVLNPVLLAIVFLALTSTSPLKNSGDHRGPHLRLNACWRPFLFGLEEFAAKLLSPLAEWFNSGWP